MKDNRLLLMVMAWLTILPLAAQKKEISQARTILKNKKNVQQAEQLMTRLLKDSVNQTNQRIYELWYESVLMQYEAANEKMYLKQKQDTADFFALTQRMFNVAWALDSLDARPDKKGRVSPELRSRHASQLIAYRPNLFFGGTYHTRKGNYDKAYSLFETYMDCVSQPLFSGYRLDSVDTRLPEAAYWATYCGYRKHDPVLTLRHRLLALQDTTKTALTLQYMAEARGWLNDDSLYYETLKAGFTRFPESQYFFPRLVDYYNIHRQYTDALSVIDSALAANPRWELALYAKSNALMNLDRFAESIAVSDSLIALNDTMPDAYYNAGTAHLNLALQLNARKDKKKLRTHYQQARTYMERYRQLMPDERQKWGPALYRIYLNLNMGRQFDEIDRLLR